ncbi:tubulin domain-containing protein [Blakeslea trispora]|nr:tubulin domain-containing protein [Blakeslea trispora]
MREIITLQLGSIANHVGTHFWNAQEEYFSRSTEGDEIDHQVLYRQGETANGQATYAPRTLIYDLKGGFGSMQKYNKLFGGDLADDPDVLWEQGIHRINRTLSKSKYQQELDRMETENDVQMDPHVLDQLDDSVNNWSDYNRIYYHPRSINPIVTHQMDNDLTPFDNYTIGRQAYVENEKETEIFEENFRFFVEECDSLQGFQILTDVDDGFGGFTEGLLHNIRDEFAKTPVLTFGLSDSFAQHRTERHKQKICLNRSLSLSRLSELSSLYVPIYTPTQKSAQQSGLSALVQLNELSRYHTSAIIAAAIETNSLPYRLKQNPATLADTIGRLNWARNTNLASLSVCLPLPISKQGYHHTLDSLTQPNQLVPILPLLNKMEKKDTIIYGEVVVARGLPSKMEQQERYLEALYARFKDENDPLQSRYSLDTSLPLPDSFPRLFSQLDASGLLDSSRADEVIPTEVPSLSYLASGTHLAATIDQHIRQMQQINLKDFWEYTQGEFSLSQEDFSEAKEKLMTLYDIYSAENDHSEMIL